MQEAASLIQSSCLGLVQYLQQIQEESGESPTDFRKAFRQRVSLMEDIDWLVPPMLQSRK